MRFIAFILAVLIMAFSCLPCDDSGLDHFASKHEQEHKAPCSHHESDLEDSCSPFCHCSCCSIFSIVNPPISVPAISSGNFTLTHFSHQSVRIFEIALPIWQPPQLRC